MHSPRPTRAEVSDVALAVRSGADAVMLSAESAAGDYPVESVTMMDTVARQTEAYQWQQGAFGSLSTRDDSLAYPSVADALAQATAQLSRDLKVRAILVISRSGRTAAVTSASRPGAPIIALSPDPVTCRRATLLWGVIPVTVDTSELDDPRPLARRLASELGFGVGGQKLLVVRGFGTNPSSDMPGVTVVSI